jgi:hypothetical protein
VAVYWFKWVIELLILVACSLLLSSEVVWLISWLFRERKSPIWERIESAFSTWEILSFGFLFGFGVLCLDFHRYPAAIMFFSLGCALLSLRMIAIAYKNLKVKWVLVILIGVVTIWIDNYLQDIVLDAQREWLQSEDKRQKDEYDKRVTALRPKKEPEPKKESNTFSLTGVTWYVATQNVGKFPCATTSTQRVLPDGTCEIKVPPGALGTGLHVEVKMRNTGESKGEDVYWHGGAEVSPELDDAGEDALFTRLTSKQIADWSEFKVGETRSLTVINEKPEMIWNSNRVRYVMLRGSFHNESGKQPDVELCKWYGGHGKALYEADRPAEYCKGHNIGIDLPKQP